MQTTILIIIYLLEVPKSELKCLKCLKLRNALSALPILTKVLKARSGAMRQTDLSTMFKEFAEADGLGLSISTPKAYYNFRHFNIL